MDKQARILNNALLVKHILKNHDSFQWSLQGFGMLRLYLSDELRLHIWNSKFRVEGVSDIHDHPWGFKSQVVCGRVINHRYTQLSSAEVGAWPAGPNTMNRLLIQCGEQAKAVYEPRPVRLVKTGEALFLPGETYTQHAAEVHSSEVAEGTITLCRRYGDPRRSSEHATVYYPLDGEWVAATPRPATQDEVFEFVLLALKQLKKIEQGPKSSLYEEEG